MPGWDRWISASGCRPKSASTCPYGTLICLLMVVISAIRDRAVKTCAAVRVGGWPRCSLLSAARIAVALPVMVRRCVRLSSPPTCAGRRHGPVGSASRSCLIRARQHLDASASAPSPRRPGHGANRSAPCPSASAHRRLLLGAGTRRAVPGTATGLKARVTQVLTCRRTPGIWLTAGSLKLISRTATATYDRLGRVDRVAGQPVSGLAKVGIARLSAPESGATTAPATTRCRRGCHAR